MDSTKTAYATVEAYLAGQTAEVQEILNHIRAIVKEEAPQATEKISYGMPGYALHGALVYFAAFKKHIGFYPTGKGMAAFMEELSPHYKVSKGTVQFPLGQPIPYDLIRRIVKFRVQENLELAKLKSAQKKK
ncbi:iron chaperone [Paenibacillus whitsoniae]|uniref:DUF1801 domain-containing protein n=1 Tax=Paenibacillus whitsoniae TaxID=2496558 RepID=A0A3R9ZZ65_9BACL|nr:DUF1801 domain-containing protein [Paenibacillus whitsoniae]RTE00550.1 DUF1801 domain-containing protein [Paenibacillus whitsoniae]